MHQQDSTMSLYVNKISPKQNFVCLFFGGSCFFSADHSPARITTHYDDTVGGAVASRLLSSTPDRAVRVQALAEEAVLCSWARHFTLTAPLSIQVFQWVLAGGE